MIRQNVRDEEPPIERKKPKRKAEKQNGWPPRWTGFRGKTVWDWLQLLIIPLVLVVIGLAFDIRQQGIEDRRAERERELEKQRAQDEALQAYLDQMSTLLLEKDLRNSEEDSEVRTLARARTLTVLEGLDPSRKSLVIQFLEEAKLIQSKDEDPPIMYLTGADLSGARLGSIDLRGAVLVEANLSDAYLRLADMKGVALPAANLSNADLWGADMDSALLLETDLSGANLRSADLPNAVLLGTDLSSASLVSTDLSDADLSDANLSGANLDTANLSGANLSEANLRGANLFFADLSDANLRGAEGVTREELVQDTGGDLGGATMPNGQKYEE